MHTLTINQARASLSRLVDEATLRHEPIAIRSEHHRAVLVSAADWAAIQENLFLLSVPHMRETIREGLATPVSECAQALDW